MGGGGNSNALTSSTGPGGRIGACSCNLPTANYFFLFGGQDATGKCEFGFCYWEL